MTEELIQVILDIEGHFNRTDIKPWPLNYVIYLEKSKAGIIPFNRALIKSGFKISYNKKRELVGIIKRSTT